MLSCARPKSVDKRRWLFKTLSNDQTAFTGFTSLVDIVDTETGFDGSIVLKPEAAFVEPFATKQDKTRKKLERLREQLLSYDSTNCTEINELLAEAKAIVPETQKRTKGKSPLFFYGVSDKPFLLQQKIYSRMRKGLQIAYAAFNTAANSLQGSIQQNAFTGSVDFMVAGNDIYLIDIGFPGVGYVADILATSKALGRKPRTGLQAVTSIAAKMKVYASQESRDLGFFKLERSYLIDALQSYGIQVDEQDNEEFEAQIQEVNLPSIALDFISRNQPLREKVLAQITEPLKELKIKTPKTFVQESDDFFLAQNYRNTRIGDEDFGLLVKKKVLFRGYQTGSNYFKPLVVPVWSREARAKEGSIMYEQYVPSLVESDIKGDISGKRAYEIRMYFVVGGPK